MGRDAERINVIIRNLSWEEKGELEALKWALHCRTWKEFAAKAKYLKGLVEKDAKTSMEIEAAREEGVVLVVKGDLGSMTKALKEKIALRRLGTPVLGFTTMSIGRHGEHGWSPVGDLLGLTEIPSGG